MKTIFMLIVCLCVVWVGYANFQNSEHQKIQKMDQLIDTTARSK